MVLPAATLVVLFGVGTLTASAHQVRLHDAAADAARLAARGEPEARVIAVAEASRGSATIHNRGDLVCVTVTASALLGLTITASSCALAGGL